MTTIVLIEHDGKRHEVDVSPGCSVMEAAVKYGIPGIEAECGGACSCATCHVYIDEAWYDRIAPAGEQEAAMLDFAAKVESNSRLSCQIKVTEALGGLVVRLPVSQY